MQSLDCPVVFDATHSTQRPGGLGGASAGRREQAPLPELRRQPEPMDFYGVHPNPEKALCDAECMLPLDQVESIIRICQSILLQYEAKMNLQDNKYRFCLAQFLDDLD